MQWEVFQVRLKEKKTSSQLIDLRILGVSNNDYPPLNEVVSTDDVKITVCSPESLSTSDSNRSTKTKPSDLSNLEQEKKMKYPTVWLGSSDGW